MNGFRHYRLEVGGFTRWADNVEELQIIYDELKFRNNLRGERVAIFNNVGGHLTVIKTGVVS